MIEVEVIENILDTPPQEIVETPDGGSISWNFLCGTESPVPLRTGGTYTYTLEDLAQMRRNLKEDVLGIKPSVYIGHEDRKSGTPASGTILDLVIVKREPFYDLYYQSQWTPHAKHDIQSGAYKYISMEALENTGFGWILTGAALTNEPAYKPMPQVAASSLTENLKKEENGMEELLKMIDPKRFLEYVITTDDGKEILVDFFKSRGEILMPQTEAAQTVRDREDEAVGTAESDIARGDTPRHDRDVRAAQTAQDKRDEAVGTGEYDVRHGDKPRGDKSVEAAQTAQDRRDEAVGTGEYDVRHGDKPRGDKSVAASALSQLNKEIAGLAVEGIAVPSGLMEEIKREVAASAYTAGIDKAVAHGVRKVLGFASPLPVSGNEVHASAASKTLSPFQQQLKAHNII